MEERAQMAALPLGNASPAPRGSVASPQPQSQSWAVAPCPTATLLSALHCTHILLQRNASFLLRMYMPCTHTHAVLTLIPHTPLTSSQTHLHICSQSSSCCGTRPFFNTSERKTENEMSPGSLFGISAFGTVGQRKLGFF